jgi:photosystem II stability/assembly factor-like uncharacterized protein
VNRALRTSIVALALATALAAGIGAIVERRHDRLPDVLDAPAVLSDATRNSTISGIARRGDRLVGVGAAGIILLSLDGGAEWKQVPSPVSSDLVSVKFIDDTLVWAVGHDAVALRSTDGGANWERMLDGRSVLQLLESTYSERAAKGDALAQEMLKELSRSAKQSATPGVLPAPFLDLWFGEGGEGYLVGAFGLILHTADGGKRWEPWSERADNEKRFHLYGATGDGQQVYLVGEQGLLLTIDRQQQRFVKVTTPYAGTYFGIDAAPARLVAYGLRGNAYVSRDEGRTWQKIDTATDAHIVAAVKAGDDRLLLVSQAGQVLALNGTELKASPLQVSSTGEVLGAASAGSRGLAFAQINGVRLVELAGRPLQ